MKRNREILLANGRWNAIVVLDSSSWMETAQVVLSLAEPANYEYEYSNKIRSVFVLLLITLPTTSLSDVSH